MVAASAQDDTATITVTDTGQGIPAEHLPHIWERFYQVADGSKPKTGAGLGLALVKELTDAMGGTASVQSEPGDGSQFSVRFPLKAADPALTFATKLRQFRAFSATGVCYA